jgi:hypothetical protein
VCSVTFAPWALPKPYHSKSGINPCVTEQDLMILVRSSQTPRRSKDTHNISWQCLSNRFDEDFLCCRRYIFLRVILQALSHSLFQRLKPVTFHPARWSRQSQVFSFKRSSIFLLILHWTIHINEFLFDRVITLLSLML